MNVNPSTWHERVSMLRNINAATINSNSRIQYNSIRQLNSINKSSKLESEVAMNGYRVRQALRDFEGRENKSINDNSSRLYSRERLNSNDATSVRRSIEASKNADVKRVDTIKPTESNKYDSLKNKQVAVKRPYMPLGGLVLDKECKTLENNKNQDNMLDRRTKLYSMIEKVDTVGVKKTVFEMMRILKESKFEELLVSEVLEKLLETKMTNLSTIHRHEEFRNADTDSKLKKKPRNNFFSGVKLNQRRSQDRSFDTEKVEEAVNIMESPVIKKSNYNVKRQSKSVNEDPLESPVRDDMVKIDDNDILSGLDQ